MTERSKFAAVVANGKLIMRCGDWRWTRDASKLPDTLAMYRRLMERKNGAYAHFYEHTVGVLERLQSAQAGGR